MNRLLRKTVWIALLCAAITALSAAIRTPDAEAAPAGGTRPVLSGTFLQLTEQHGGWDRARWDLLFDTLYDIGVRQVVVQWTLLDERAFFPSKTFRQVPKPPVEEILASAQARGMEVYLGTAAESAYWERVKDPSRLEEYLRRLRWKSERVAQELVPLASRYRSFRGWYLPEEIDDLTWRAPEPRNLLFRHLRQLSAYLKRLTPDRSVALSGFSRARMSPATYERFWRELLRESSVDLLLFQDGTGTGKLPDELLPHYLQAVRNAADASGRKLKVVVELFTLVSEAPFKAVPAPISRVRKQLELAARYATGGIGSFSVPDYMSAEGVIGAPDLLREYRKYEGGE